MTGKIPPFQIHRVHLDVTGRCNSNCKHCHMSEYSTKEFSNKELLNILRELKKNKIKRVALSGGEPFLREDIFEIIKKGPKEISILTNATLINKEKLRKIIKIKNKNITFRISLDGLDSHDKIRDYSYKKTLKKIKMVREFGFITVVNSTVSPFLKKNEIKKLLDKLEKIKVDQWNIDIPFNEGNFKNNKMKNRLNFILKEFQSLIKYYLSKKFNIRLDIVGLFCSEKIKRGEGFYKCNISEHPCNYQLHAATINPLGEIQLCPSLHLSFGDIKEGLVSYRKKLKWKRFVKIKRDAIKGCKKCKYLLICGGGCRANAFSFSGNLLGKDELSCRLMKYLDKKIIRLYPKKIQQQFKEYTKINF